jgi:hypothetical protein
MAARLNPEHDERTREKIRTSQLINRLNSLVSGEIDPASMPPHAVTAALGLLKKVLPDLQATTISGDQDNPLRVAPDLSRLNPEQLRALASIPLTGE